MNKYKIATIGGDGIGPDVIASGVRVLEAAAGSDYKLEFTPLDWGSARYLEGRGYMPEDGLDILRGHHSAYFGAVGSRDVPDHISLRELRIAICVGLNLEVCTRPVWMLGNVQSPLRLASPKDVNWLFIRQNVLGEYAGRGSIEKTPDGRVGTDVAVYCEESIRRIARYAFEAARKRSKKRVTFGTKSNAMPYGMVLWDETILSVAAEFPDIECERVLSDALLARMLRKPDSLDVILGTNLHADLLTDAGAEIMGSLGLAPSGNIDPTRQNPPMFEPTHGSAYDLIGTGRANPIGAILSGALMLEYLGESAAARRINDAVNFVTCRQIGTSDIRGNSTMARVTDAICHAVAG